MILALNDELYYHEDLPEHDNFVYYYESGSYEGDGFAVWNLGDKFYYGELSHCSCFGPTDSLDNTEPYTLEEMERIVKNYTRENGPQVLQTLKEVLSER